MTSAPFVFTEEAETQLLKMLDYLADQSESAAIRVRTRLTTLFGSLPRGRVSATLATTKQIGR